jgi:hypothetical protein
MKLANLSLKRICVAAVWVCSAGLASAETYSNSNDGGTIGMFGSHGTPNFGEVFQTTGGVLSDWTFFASNGSMGNLKLVVANWDGYKAVGPSLYESLLSYGGDAQALSFSGINANLAAGSYIAYLTVAGVHLPATSVAFAGSNSNGGLGGSFAYLNSGGVDPLTQSSVWSNISSYNLQYSATIAPVPEPETYAMMLAGLGLIGGIARRRKCFTLCSLL